MQNPSHLLTDRISEQRFRELAGLCQECGEARAEPERTLCEVCRRVHELEVMEAQWREWGIAA